MDWKTDYLAMKMLSPFRVKLLKEGAKSLSQSWILQAMYNDYKRIKGIKEIPPPDCQSSFKEWNDKVENYNKEDVN